MSSNTPATSWSTLTVVTSKAPTSREALALLEYQLESLGALLLEHEAVSGVEYRDAKTFEVAERPSLVVYTSPAALAELERRAAEIAPELGLPPLVTHAVTTDDDSWRDSWKEFFKPLRPGDGRLLIRPSWIAPREDDPSLEIILDPGRAFGTGQHESTSLCLEILASLHSVNTIGPARVLDLGCGSGILALAAARFWPQAEVVAIDVDEEAVETTRENARDNGLEHRVVAARGTPDDLRDHFDLVLANIRPSVLIPSAAQIAAATRGTLVMSGILDEEFTEVIAAYRPLGFSDALPPQREGGWSAACLERR